MKTRKKLIEVALPLDAVNKAAAREKSIRHGHPSTLHLWWARRPLAAARAVIFAQMVDDPSEYVDVLLSDAKKRRAAEKELKKRLEGHAAKRSLVRGDAIAEPEPTLEEVITEQERERLFDIIEDLVLWENTTNEEVIERARTEIRQSWRRACAENAGHPRAKELYDRHQLPAFHDPFAGGGALPLEAQRLGLEAHASDLNPVAVLINKAMIEIPPKFAGRPPVNPEWRNQSEEEQTLATWRGAQGLAEDVRYYGRWMREEAEKRIGQLYPKVEITSEMVKERPDLKRYEGKKLTVIAWLWARTVKSPNPAFADVEVPLASTFMLSTKKGKEAYVEPMIEGKNYRFTVNVGTPPDPTATKAGTKLSRGANFRCLMSGTPIAGDYIKVEGQAKRMGARLMAIVAEGARGRVYIAPSVEHEETVRKVFPAWHPELKMPRDRRWFSPPLYGLPMYGDLFTPRQLVALTTFSDLVTKAMERVQRDAATTGLPDDNRPLHDGGMGARAYAEAVGVYLGFALSKQADLGNNLCAWEPIAQCPRHLFARQAIPMVWDYAEGNPLGQRSGSWSVFVEGIVKAYSKAFESVKTSTSGRSQQADAGAQSISFNKLISTDPPYYDNIGYADLSDFFYVWLRLSLRSAFPELFATLAVPKAEELVATPYRHGNKEKAETFFLSGMTVAMRGLANQAHRGFPSRSTMPSSSRRSKGKREFPVQAGRPFLAP